jgi:hypothetical protein
MARAISQRLVEQGSPERLPDLPFPTEALADVDERMKYYARELDSAVRAARYVFAAKQLSPTDVSNVTVAVGRAEGLLKTALEHPLNRDEAWQRIPAARSWSGDESGPTPDNE